MDLNDRSMGCDLRVDGNLALGLFALLIGINDYPEMKQLKGAVPDAESMADYLRSKNVPNDHILEMHNDKATRCAIIEALEKIAHDVRIKKGDPILIFYAGHGCEIDAPEGWETDGRQIQAIVPFDVKTPGSNDRMVEVIPDRTFAVLLDKIAEEKGDNITVILDCCHSTSGTRDDESLDIIVRSVDAKDLPPLSPDIDHAIVESSALGRVSVMAPGFAHRSLRSHTLLAACEASEKAWEEYGNGVFTNEILLVLKSTNTDTLTYVELIQRLSPLPRQHPQCEGFNRNRVLFNGGLAAASPGMVRVQVEEDNSLKLPAGRVQGIVTGARFEVYQHHLIGDFNPCLGILQVTAAGEFNSILGTREGIPGLRNPAYARQVGASQGRNIWVYVSPKIQDKFKDNELWQTIFLSESSGLSARPTSDQALADLSLDVSFDDRVTFQTHNSLVNQHGITVLPYTTGLDVHRVLGVLSAASAWHWHASRTNPTGSWRDKLQIKMYEVREGVVGKGDDAQVSMIKVSENLNESGLARIAIDPSKPLNYYGYQIVNDTDTNLYPYLFYFDASDFSITQYHFDSVPSSQKVDSPLPGGGRLSLGYGTNGSIPFSYCMVDEQTVDMGIVKLFVSDKPISFDLIEQCSPFEDVPSNKRGLHFKDRAAKKPLWDTQSMVLVQYMKS